MSEEILDRLDQIERLTLLAAKDVLSVEDVCFLTGFSAKHVRMLAETHQVAYSRPGGRRLFFRKQDINAYLTADRIPSVGEILNDNERKNITPRIRVARTDGRSPRGGKMESLPARR